MMKKVLLFVLLVSVWLSGCQKDILRHKDPEMVVEGWIESGKYPVVMLSTTIPVNEEPQDLSDLSAYVIKWGKVTISDGEKEVTLIGTPRKRYFPPYIYTTSEIKGECGKTYKLKADYGEYHAEATTTIPKAAVVDSCKVLSVAGNDSLYQLKVFIQNNEPGVRKYYKIASRIYPEEGYYRSYINSVLTSDAISVSAGINVSPGVISGQKDYSSLFHREDTVMVRVARIDSVSYQFWHDYENIMATARNPIFKVHLNLRSNIIGGKGYWCGYGSEELLILPSMLDKYAAADAK